MAAGFLIACGSDRAPSVPDSVPPETREAPLDGGTRGAEIRGAAPALPAADVDVVLPFQGAEERVRIAVDAAPRRLDLHLSIDTTSSFSDEIDTIQGDLRDRIVPALTAQVPDVAFGVSRFEDFPAEPFGQAMDRPFELLSPVSVDRDRVASAIAALDQPLGQGGDPPEASLEALYQIATGTGYETGAVEYIAPFDSLQREDGGGVGFREGSLRTVMHITDAPAHLPADYGTRFPGTRGLEATSEALRALGIHVIGVSSGPGAREHLEALATATEALMEPEDGRCPTGIAGATRMAAAGTCPLVFDVNPDGSGLSGVIEDAIVRLLDTVRYRSVRSSIEDDRLSFVQVVAAVAESGGAENATRVDQSPVDGVEDTFVDVRARTKLTFEVRLRNTLIPSADYEQVFRVRVNIVGDDVVLCEHIIRVRVPAAIPNLPTSDAGTDAGVLNRDGGSSDAQTDDAQIRDAQIGDV